MVQTLHAYARRLLAAHPFEARLHPNLAVDADGSAQRAVVRRVLDARLREAYVEDGDALALATAGHGPHELELELLALLESGVSARDLRGDPLATEFVAAFGERLRERLRAFGEASDGRLRDATSSRVGVQTAQLVEEMLAALPEGAASIDTVVQLA